VTSQKAPGGSLAVHDHSSTEIGFTEYGRDGEGKR
jgi:hypothetical protein